MDNLGRRRGEGGCNLKSGKTRFSITRLDIWTVLSIKAHQTLSKSIFSISMQHIINHSQHLSTCHSAYWDCYYFLFDFDEINHQTIQFFTKKLYLKSNNLFTQKMKNNKKQIFLCCSVEFWWKFTFCCTLVGAVWKIAKNSCWE